MQTLIFGLEVSVIGMGIVFIGLVFLIGVIKVMCMFTASIDKKKSAIETVTPSVTATTSTEKNNSEILAVISAAVAMMTGGNGRIVTISRVREEYVPGWAAAGRQETMKLRQEV